MGLLQADCISLSENVHAARSSDPPEQEKEEVIERTTT